MRQTQPNPYTILVIRFLTTLMRKDADSNAGFGAPNSEGVSLRDAMKYPRNEWQETVAMSHDISVAGMRTTYVQNCPTDTLQKLHLIRCRLACTTSRKWRTTPDSEQEPQSQQG